MRAKETPKADGFDKITASDISNLKSKFTQEQDFSENDAIPQSTVRNPQLAEIIAAMPVKMPPISSEELEHFDEDKLDTAYQNKLLRAGDNLFPISNAVKIVEELIGVSNANGFSGFSDNQSGSAAAFAPAKAKPAFEIPNFDTGEDSDELPVLPENPTQAELNAYAEKHPLVKKVLRAFRGKIVEVKKLS